MASLDLTINPIFFPPKGALRIADEDILHTIVDFLSFLKLKGGRGSELIRLQCENITLSGKKKDMNINNQRNATQHNVCVSDMGALDSLPSSLTSDEFTQP